MPTIVTIDTMCCRTKAIISEGFSPSRLDCRWVCAIKKREKEGRLTTRVPAAVRYRVSSTVPPILPSSSRELSTRFSVREDSVWNASNSAVMVASLRLAVSRAKLRHSAKVMYVVVGRRVPRRSIIPRVRDDEVSRRQPHVSNNNGLTV